MKFTYRSKSFDFESKAHDDYIYDTIAKSQSFYEIDLLEYMSALMKRLAKKNTLAIDVGANIGNHSVYMRSFFADHLIAIEPNPDILPYLQRNLQHNIDGYTIFRCAAGEADGTGSMFMPEESDNNIGMARVVIDEKEGAIQVSTLDSIFAAWKKTSYSNYSVDIIKIDVEGMELSVLKGAKDIITKCKPHIFAEALTLKDYLQISEFLHGFGYKTLSQWAGTPVFHFASSPSPALVMWARWHEKRQGLKNLVTRIKGRLQGKRIAAGK